MKQKHFIDSHKGSTGTFILFLMFYFDQFENMNAWVYLALHGSYGIMWVMKSMVFPDKTWEVACGFFYGLYMWAGLTLYWISPWIITSVSKSVAAKSMRIFSFLSLSSNFPRVSFFGRNGLYQTFSPKLSVLISHLRPRRRS